MQRRVAIVTDSTAALPREVVEQYGITVVPLRLRIGQHATDESHVSPDDVAAALHNEVAVSTAEPLSPEFFWAYNDAALAGHSEIVSLHISEHLSATAASARQAAARMNIPVHVVNSLTTGLSLGFLVIAAAETAARGATAEAILGEVEDLRRRTSQMIYVDGLEHLRRGGRIGKASALLGAALSIRPVLKLSAGKIVPLAKVPGSDRALKLLVNEGVKRSGHQPVDVGVEFFDMPDRASSVARRLRARIPQLRRLVVTRTSTVLAAHVGPGAIGLAISPCPS